RGILPSLQPPPHPVPHRGHVGKEAEVAKGRALRGETDLGPGKRPALLRDRASVLPATASVLVRAGNEFTVGIPPGQPGPPQRLRFGPDEAMRAVTLQLAAVAAVYQAVVGPALAGEDQRGFGQLGHQLRGTALSAT